MKRLRYILWAIIVCIEAELHPGECLETMCHNPNFDDEICGCDAHYCILPAGHIAQHCNNTGLEW